MLTALQPANGPLGTGAYRPVSPGLPLHPAALSPSVHRYLRGEAGGAGGGKPSGARCVQAVLVLLCVSLASRPLWEGILRAGTGDRTAPHSVRFAGACEGADAGFESYHLQAVGLRARYLTPLCLGFLVCVCWGV